MSKRKGDVVLDEHRNEDWFDIAEAAAVRRKPGGVR